MWDLAPVPDIEPESPALEAWTQPLDIQGSPSISLTQVQDLAPFPNPSLPFF